MIGSPLSSLIATCKRSFESITGFDLAVHCEEQTPACIISMTISHCTQVSFFQTDIFFFRRFVLKVGNKNEMTLNTNKPSGQICQDVTRRLPPPTEAPRHPTTAPLVLPTLPTAAERKKKEKKNCEDLVDKLLAKTSCCDDSQLEFPPSAFT